jgi:hypothetical protein
MDKTKLSNETMNSYSFLTSMYLDNYFPDFLVLKCEKILVRLCETIEQQKPSNLQQLYGLTETATEEFNNLQEEFYDNESEIETVARDCIAVDFEKIAHVYGFEGADIEELVAARDW